MTNPPRIAIPIFEIADNSLSSSSFLLAHSNATFPFLMHVFQECILQNVHAFVHFLYEKATTPLMHSKYSSGKCLLLSSTTNQRFILLPFPMAKIFRFRLSTTLLYIPLLQLSTGETAWAKIYTFKKKTQTRCITVRARKGLAASAATCSADSECSDQEQCKIQVQAYDYANQKKLPTKIHPPPSSPRQGRKGKLVFIPAASRTLLPNNQIERVRRAREGSSSVTACIVCVRASSSSFSLFFLLWEASWRLLVIHSYIYEHQQLHFLLWTERVGEGE